MKLKYAEMVKLYVKICVTLLINNIFICVNIINNVI